MSKLIFSAAPAPTLPIVGSDDRIPVQRVFCVGRNYEEHAREMGQQVERDEPFYFTKSNEAVVQDGAVVPYPSGTDNFHYEFELVVVIGKPAFKVSVADALSHVYGYACGLDMTRRDLQLKKRAKQLPWDIGKDVEHSAPISAVVPAARFGVPKAQKIEMRQNGVTRQSADLSLMIWSVAEIISHLSTLYHLRPGDVIMSGTPAGVGPCKAGDVLEGTIEGAGSLKVTIGAPV
jgi:fumarylpyruvate hydrolase